LTKAKDEQFSAFISARGTSLYRLATLLAGDPSDGEDLLQIVLEKTYRRWDRLEAVATPEAYVRQALVNAARSHWRLRLRRGEHLLDQPPDAAVYGGQDTMLIRRSLLEALGGLTRQQRAVIVLRFFADQDEAEVARMLGCSVGTVKAHSSRGLRRLRDNFEHSGTTYDLVQE
jgi:RNA polymerase sigma-70 factor (sigma-E family)